MSFSEVTGEMIMDATSGVRWIWSITITDTSFRALGALAKWAKQ